MFHEYTEGYRRPDVLDRDFDGNVESITLTYGADDRFLIPIDTTRYPDRIKVGPNGRLTLRALGSDTTLKELFTTPFVSILQKAQQRLHFVSFVGDDVMDRVQEGEIRVLATQAAFMQSGASRTLEFLCTNDPSEWSNVAGPQREYHSGMLEDALWQLDEYFAVPCLRVNKAWAQEFLKDGAHAGKSFLQHVGHLTVADLVLKKRSFVTDFERSLIVEARINGLLWCNPQGWEEEQLPIRLDELVTGITGVVIENPESGSGGMIVQGSTSSKIEYEVEVGQTCNSAGTACVDVPDLDTYCQMVEGECNILSG
jgi:hypothetical protein